jgi:solute carrier family 35, member F1/2
MSPPMKNSTVVAASGSDIIAPSPPGSGDVSPVHGAPEILSTERPSERGNSDADARPRRKRDRFGYLMTMDFWIVLLIGQVLALCITGTNTLTTLLVMEGTSIPAFQTFFNYVLLNIIYTSFTMYKYGLKGWAKLILKDGWKCECPTVSCSPASFIL